MDLLRIAARVAATVAPSSLDTALKEGFDRYVEWAGKLAKAAKRPDVGPPLSWFELMAFQAVDAFFKKHSLKGRKPSSVRDWKKVHDDANIMLAKVGEALDALRENVQGRGDNHPLWERVEKTLPLEQLGYAVRDSAQELMGRVQDLKERKDAAEKLGKGDLYEQSLSDPEASVILDDVMEESGRGSVPLRQHHPRS